MFSRRHVIRFLGACLLALLATVMGSAVTLEQIVSREHPYFNVAGAIMSVGRDGKVYLTSGNLANNGANGYILRLNRDGTGKSGGVTNTEAVHNATANASGYMASDHAHFAACVNLMDPNFNVYSIVRGFTTSNYDEPSEVDVGASGDFYAVDPSVNRVVRINQQGKIVNSYYYPAPVQGRYMTVRVCEATQTMYFIQGYVNGIPATYPVVAVGFDGTLKWTLTISQTGLLMYDRVYGGYDVDDAGNLYTLGSNAQAINKWDANGNFVSSVALTGAPISGGDLRVFGNDAVINYNNTAYASKTELFRVFDLTTGALVRTVQADYDKLDVTYSNTVWTAGSVIPFTISFTPGGGRSTSPNWQVWLRAYGQSDYTLCTWSNGQLTIPANLSGLYQLKVTAEVSPWNGFSDYLVEDMVEIRPSGALGSVSVLTPNNRLAYAAGDPVNFSVIYHTDNTNNLPSSVTVSLKDDQGTVLANGTAPISSAQTQQNFFIPSAITAGLRPGCYTLTVSSAGFSTAAQPLVFGQGDKGRTFRNLIYGDYGLVTTATSNPWDVRDTVARTTKRLDKLGIDFMWDNIGTSFLTWYVNWDGTSNSTMSTLASRLSGDQKAVDSGKVMDESPYKQSLANYSAQGVQNYARLENMDTGMPIGTGITERNEAQFESDIATLTNACLPYSSFKGWGWAGNWWPGNSISSMGNAQEQSDYSAAFSAANSTGTWATILDTLSNRWLAQPATQWGLFNTKLNTITNTLKTNASGPARNPMGYPPTNFAPVDGVDLQCQFEQIPIAYMELYSTDFYKRPGKPAYGHPEVWNDSGTGEEILPTCLSFFMRGANATGCSSNFPWWGEYFDSRNNNGITSIFRAMNTTITKPYGPWYVGLQQHDPIALVSSSREYQLDNDRGWTGIGCKHFMRMYEAYVALMHAHYPATIVLGNDVTPTCLNGYKAIVLVDQVYQLEPALVTALANAQAAGVPIFYDGTCLASLMTGYTPLNISFNKFDSSGAGDDYGSIRKLIDYIRQDEPALASAFASITPPATVGIDEVFVTERTAESARYVAVLNHSTPTELSSSHLWRMATWAASRVPVQTTVGLGDLTGKTVYDVFARQQVTPSGGNVTADLRTLPMRIYAILPAAINSIELTGPNTAVTAGQPISWQVRVLDSGSNAIAASIPIRLRLYATDGVTVLQELFTAAGSAGATGTLTVPRNAVGGSAKLEAAELLSGKCAVQTITVNAAGVGTLPLQGQGAPSQDSPLPASYITTGAAALSGLSTAASQFGPHLRDLIITNNGTQAVMNASNWGTNLYAVNLSDGSVSYRKRVGQFFTYAPIATNNGAAVQGFNFPDGNGYGLYLVDGSGNLTKRFNLYGLPKRLPHRFATPILSETMNNFAVPADTSWVATSGSLGLAVWNSAGTLLWHNETLQSCRLVALNASALLVVNGITATAYNPATGDRLWQIVLANNGAIAKIAASSDGAYCALATSANGGTVYVLKNGTLVATLITVCNDLGISANGASVAVVTGNMVKLYDVATGLKWSFSGDDTLCFPRFSADGSKLAVSSVLGTVDVLSTTSGATLCERDMNSLAVPAWHAGGDLILATWNGWVYRLNGSTYAQSWATQVTPVETDMHGHLLDSDGTTAITVPNWDNADNTQPLTPNLGYDSTGVTKVTFLAYDSNWNPANGFAGFIRPTNTLFDGSSTPPTDGWLDWSNVGALSQVGEMWPYQFLQLDTWRRQLNITGITYVEDPAHPESWVRESYLQYWDPAAQLWRDGEAMLADAPIHTHMFTTPVQASRIRIKMPTTAPGNLRLAELVLHGTNLGANHPDVIAQHDTAVLFDENMDEFTTTASVNDYLHGSVFQTGGAYSGGICIYQKVAGGVRGNITDANYDNSPDGTQPGWDFVISANPQPGQYRYLTFAVKGKDAGTTGMKVGLRPTTWNSFAFYVGADPNPGTNGSAWLGTVTDTQVGATVPLTWTSYTVDLSQYFPEGTHVQGIFMLCGGGDGYFDRVLLSRTATPNEFPTVSLTDPGEGACYTVSPATVVINANASDYDGTITQVQFFQNGTLLGTDSTYPYSYTWSNAPTGSYTLTAQATDNGGLTTTSAPMHITINNAPTVSITAPSDNAIFTAPADIAITASATDADGSIAKVEFYQDGTWRGQTTSSPYAFTWTNVQPGTYTLTARATDNLGSLTESSVIHLTVNSAGANNPPTVTLTSPTEGQFFTPPASITLTATAADSDGTVTKVDFYNGTTLLGTDSTSPYSYTWTNVAQGTYALTAKATDNSNNVATSTAVTVIVQPANQSPTVSITSPADWATFTAPATISLSASASDADGSISKVEFYNVSTLLTTLKTSPYSYNWQNVPAGCYLLTAKAYDNQNAVTTSTVVHLTVNPGGGSYDTSTQGSWWSSTGGYIYGSRGYVLCAWNSNSTDVVNLMPGTGGYVASVTPTGNSNYCWAANQSDARATINPATGTRDAACWYNNFDALVTLNNPNDGITHRMAVYCLDWDSTSRSQYLDLINPTTGLSELPNPIAVTNFHNGVWVLFNFTGNVKLRLTNNGGPNPVVSAICFDNPFAPPTVSLTSPSEGAQFIAPATIPLAATASSNNGIAKVDFYQGAALIGTSTSSPFTCTWSNVDVGSYTLTAIATDSYGTSAFSQVVHVSVSSLPTNGMLLWLRADALAANNGDPVNTWTDSSGHGRNAVFTQIGGVGVPPTVATNVFNGKPVVRFNGNSLLQVSSLPLGTYTIVAVFKTSSNNEIVYEHGDDMNFNPTGNFLFTSTTSTVSVKRFGVQTGKDIVESNAYTWAANPTVALMTMDQFDGTDAGEKLFINTAPQWLNENYVGNLNTTTPTDLHFNIGLRAGWGGLQFHGDIAEIVVYDHALTGADLATLNTALMTKYGLNAPPTVTLTAPTGGSVFTAPANITLTATATDSDGTISKVEFYNGFTLIGTASTSPYSYAWNNVAAGSYAITAIAYDNTNLTAVSSSAGITVNALPMVSITAPAPGQVFTAPATIAITATASDSDGTISKVEFYNGAALLGTASTSPYGYTWTNVGAGSYTLTAKAYDNYNATSTSSGVNVIVDTAPAVSITAPTPGQVFTAPATITITATASDSDGTISKVEFYNGAALLGTDSTSPYSYTWSNVASGSYTLTAKAYDNYNVTTTSSGVNVISDTAPTVSLTAPAANTNYIAPASVAITATASDSDGTISKVEFYQGSTLVGTASTSPYNFTWTNVAMGNYSLTAKAYDNNNVTTTSSAVNIIVWGTSDIGSVGVAGSASYASGTFTVSGAGAGVTSTADAFRYVYRQFSGNTTIVARVASATSPSTATRAGVMMRQNLNANSIEAAAMYKPTSTYYVYFLRRTSAGGSTSSTSSTAAAVPYWVKVVRSSNTLSAFMSANGTSWTQVGSNTTVTMTDPIYVGLAVTSGSTSAAKTVTFDNVSITQP